MPHPYKRLPAKAFWRTAIAERNMLEIDQLWKAKNPILREDKVATAGSCFAQHISQAMIANGFKWLDSEPAPHGILPANAKAHGYGVFTFRTGNIYTSATLREWVEASFGIQPLSDEVWETDGRFYDPLRPAIEPNGFESVEELMSLRRFTLSRMAQTLCEANLFIFTLGLTESWRNRKTGFVYAACPGTIAGTFSTDLHEFHNQSFPEIIADMNASLDLIRRHNPTIKFLLTVSPVPLVATAADDHVLVSTTYSKSVLRAVSGTLKETRPDTDYFPSYEIINSSPFRGSFFMPNQREVASAGVRHVMKHFFAGIGIAETAKAERVSSHTASITPPMNEAAVDIQCEEALLEAFSR